MSTKAIRRVLNGALEHPNGGDDVRAATAEVEAIEKAAKDISTYLSHGQPERYCLALALFDRIAKDAK